MNLLYKTCNIGLRQTLKMFTTSYEVEGLTNVPRNDPLIIVSNHLAKVDPGILSASIKRRLNFAAKSDLFKNPILRILLNSYGAIPLKRSQADLKAFKTMLYILSKSKGTMVIFPEGHRSNGNLLKAKTGIAKIALHSKANLIPVSITGTNHLRSVLRVLKPTGSIKITCGKPFKLQDGLSYNEKTDLEGITNEVMLRIANLLPENYRGFYNKRTEFIFTKELFNTQKEN